MVDQELKDKFSAILNGFGCAGSIGNTTIKARTIKEKRQRLKSIHKNLKGNRLTRNVDHVNEIFNEIIADLSPLD